MTEVSAGLLLYRRTGAEPEVLLVHFGGPLWAKRDEGAWSIPKGLCGAGEEPLAAARREFEEETGGRPGGPFVPLGDFKQSRKIISAWAVEGDFDLTQFKSNQFVMEWPPRSGSRQEFPEADRAGWFCPEEAMRKVVKGQVAIIQAWLRTLRK